MSQTGTLHGCDSNDLSSEGLLSTQSSGEQGFPVSVVAPTIKFKKGEVVLDRNKPLGPLGDHGNCSENVKCPPALQVK